MRRHSSSGDNRSRLPTDWLRARTNGCKAPIEWRNGCDGYIGYCMKCDIATSNHPIDVYRYTWHLVDEDEYTNIMEIMAP